MVPKGDDEPPNGDAPVFDDGMGAFDGGGGVDLLGLSIFAAGVSEAASIALSGSWKTFSRVSKSVSFRSLSSSRRTCAEPSSKSKSPERAR